MDFALPCEDPHMEAALGRLTRSSFRRKQRLSKTDAADAKRRGRETIRRHAAEILGDRLAPAQPVNDGKQTPFRGHAVFTAQHATATCCRSCLAKWHAIDKGRPMRDDEVAYATALIVAWIDRQLESRWEASARPCLPLFDDTDM